MLIVSYFVLYIWYHFLLFWRLTFYLCYIIFKIVILRMRKIWFKILTVIYFQSLIFKFCWLHISVIANKIILKVFFWSRYRYTSYNILFVYIILTKRILLLIILIYNCRIIQVISSLDLILFLYILFVRFTFSYILTRLWLETS